MKSAKCDLCKEEIKTKKQFYIEIHSCITGTASYSDGEMEEEKWIKNYDICDKCMKKIWRDKTLPKK